MIHLNRILPVDENYDSVLRLSGRRLKPQNKGPVPIRAAINDPPPMHSLCICNEKHFMYYLYCICKLAVSCAPIEKKPPLYKNVCKS